LDGQDGGVWGHCVIRDIHAAPHFHRGEKKRAEVGLAGWCLLYIKKRRLFPGTAEISISLLAHAISRV
jgi:hypothetical protein